MNKNKIVAPITALCLFVVLFCNSPVYSAVPTYIYPVWTFDNTFTEWTEHGTSPYLTGYSFGNWIETSANNKQEGYWSFKNTTRIPYKVWFDLDAAYNYVPGNITVTLYDGFGNSTSFNVYPYTPYFTIYSHDVSNFLNNQTKFNNAYFKLTSVGVILGVAADYARLRLQEEFPSAQIVIIYPENTTLTTQNIEVNLYAYGGTIDRVWFNIKNGSQWIYTVNVTYWEPVTIGKFNDGVYTIYAYANNTLGSFASASTHFTVLNPPVTVYYYPVIGYTGEFTQWVKHGTTPYLTGVTWGNYISTNINFRTDGCYTFKNTSRYPGSVYLAVHAAVNFNGSQTFNVTIDNGETSGTFAFQPDTTGYAFYRVDVTNYVNTKELFNGASIKFESTSLLPIEEIYIDYARLELTEPPNLQSYVCLFFASPPENVHFTVKFGDEIQNCLTPYIAYFTKGTYTITFPEYTGALNEIWVFVKWEEDNSTSRIKTLNVTSGRIWTVLYKVYPTGPMNPLLPLMFILGMIGLVALFGGPTYAIYKVKHKEYYSGLVNGLIFTVIGIALFIAWVWT